MAFAGSVKNDRGDVISRHGCQITDSSCEGGEPSLCFSSEFIAAELEMGLHFALSVGAQWGHGATFYEHARKQHVNSINLGCLSDPVYD